MSFWGHGQAAGTSSSPSASPSASPPQMNGSGGNAPINSSRRDPPKKRNRAALSCVACRERKIKCNREVPCDQCTKRGDADLCFLDPYKRGPPANQSKSSKVQAQLAAQSEQIALRQQEQQQAQLAAAHAQAHPNYQSHSSTRPSPATHRSSSGSSEQSELSEFEAIKTRLAQLEAVLNASGRMPNHMRSSLSDPPRAPMPSISEVMQHPQHRRRSGWRSQSQESNLTATEQVGNARDDEVSSTGIPKSAHDSDTEDAAMVLEGLAMSGQDCATAKHCPVAADPVKTEPKESFVGYAARNKERDIMLDISQGGTSKLSADEVTACQRSAPANGVPAQKYEDYVELERRGIDVSPANKMCSLLKTSSSLLRPIYGPESFLGFGMGWAFPAAESARDLHISGGECPGSAQREAVLRAIIRALPRKQLAMQLLSVYCERVNFLAGNVVHVPTLRKEVEAFYALETVERQARAVNNIDPAWLSVLLVVMCLGLRFYPCTPPDGWQSMSHLFDGRSIHLYSSAARTCLLLARYQSAHSLAVLQSILLSNLSDSHAGRKPDHSLLRIAISNAHAMGLHRLGDKSQQPRAGEGTNVGIRREIAKRIWYQLVFKDWSASINTGVYVIHDRQFNTPLPGNYNDADLEKSPLPAPYPRDQHTEMSYALEIIEVVKATKFQTDVFNERWLAQGETPSPGKSVRVTCSDAAHLDAAYRNLLDKLPPFFAVGAAEGKDPNLEIQRWLVQQMIFHHLLKLHRPALSSKQQARTVCVNLARSILETQKKLRSKCTVIDRLLCNLAQSYTAAIVLVLDLLQHGEEQTPEMRSTVRSEVAEALRALHHVNESNNSTQSGIKVIEALLQEEEVRWQSRLSAGGAGHKRKRDGSTQKKELLNLALRLANAAKGGREKKAVGPTDSVTVEHPAGSIDLDAMMLGTTDGLANESNSASPQQELSKDALSRALMAQLFTLDVPSKDDSSAVNLALGGQGGTNLSAYNNLFGNSYSGLGGGDRGVSGLNAVGLNGVEANLSPANEDANAFDLDALLRQYDSQQQSPDSAAASSYGSGSSSYSSGDNTSFTASDYSNSGNGNGNGHKNNGNGHRNGKGNGAMDEQKLSGGNNAPSQQLSPSHGHSDPTSYGLDAFYNWILSQSLNGRDAQASQAQQQQQPQQQQQQQPSASGDTQQPSSSMTPVSLPPSAQQNFSNNFGANQSGWQAPFGGPPHEAWSAHASSSAQGQPMDWGQSSHTGGGNNDVPPSSSMGASGLTPLPPGVLNVGTPTHGADPTFLTSGATPGGGASGWLSGPGFFDLST